MEPMDTTNSRNLAISLFEYYNDREDISDNIIRVMLVRAQFSSSTHGHFYSVRTNNYKRQNQNARSAKLRVNLDAKIFFSGNSS